MKYRLFLYAFTFILPATFAIGRGGEDSLAVKYGLFDTDNIPKDEYRQRRDSVLQYMVPGSAAVFRANDPCRRNSGLDYGYRQNSDFLYLTGCNESNSTLILVAGGVRIDTLDKVKCILFMREAETRWSGSTLGVEGAEKILGFSDAAEASVVLTNDRLWDVMPEIFKSAHVLYYTPSLPDIVFDPISDRKFVTISEVRKGIEQKYPGLILKDSGVLTHGMRMFKSQAELVLLQKAVFATVEGETEAIKKCAPGIYEYQLEAVLEECFLRSGCEYAGFPSIIGSGPNSLIIHYMKNRRCMNAGELVVIDAGGEYHGYSADITRTVPVSGKFSTAQKDIYGIVLAAQKAEISAMRPGAAIADIDRIGSEVVAEGLVKLGIISDKSERRMYLPHRTIHPVGLDVHDPMPLDTLLPGMVFAVEPGIYIPDTSKCDKKYLGIAVRIEDDVLVTEDGCNVLSDRLPKSISGIENLMKKRRK
jgi:Xaa-Pro aminopeptidase